MNDRTMLGAETAVALALGRLQPGDSVPSVDEVAELTGASRHEVVTALDALATRHSVEWLATEGRLVAGRILHRVDRGQPASLSQSIALSGRATDLSVHHALLDV